MIVVVLGACGAPARPTAPAPAREAPRAHVDAPLSDVERAAQLAAKWQALGINGGNWKQRVATIPADDQRAMAIRLLHQGNFACPSLPVGRDQCPGEALQRLPTDGSTISDPCVRRLLALWAIDQLGDDPQVLADMYPTLVALVKLPPPEHELGEAALTKMPSPFHLAGALWEAKAVGNLGLVATHPLEGFEVEDLRIAALDFHLDAAVLALAPADHADIYRWAINDEYLLPATRLRAIEVSTELAHGYADEIDVDNVKYALGTAAREGDCAIAAAASAALASLGEGAAPVPQGPFRSVDEVIHAACTVLGQDARGSVWKPLVGKRVTIVDHREDPFRIDALWTKYPFAYDNDMDGVPDVPEADPDGDGDVATTRKSRVVGIGKRFTLPHSDELKLALPHCIDADCYVPGTSVWFHLDIGAVSGGGLRLHGVERHERVGADC